MMREELPTDIEAEVNVQEICLPDINDISDNIPESNIPSSLQYIDSECLGWKEENLQCQFENSMATVSCVLASSGMHNLHGSIEEFSTGAHSVTEDSSTFPKESVKHSSSAVAATAIEMNAAAEEVRPTPAEEQPADQPVRRRSRRRASLTMTSAEVTQYSSARSGSQDTDSALSAVLAADDDLARRIDQAAAAVSIGSEAEADYVVSLTAAYDHPDVEHRFESPKKMTKVRFIDRYHTKSELLLYPIPCQIRATCNLYIDT